MTSVRYNDRSNANPFEVIARFEPQPKPFLEGLCEGLPFYGVPASGPITRAVLGAVKLELGQRCRKATVTVRHGIRYDLWHTDFGYPELGHETRRQILNFMLVTGPPLPIFVREADFEAPLEAVKTMVLSHEYFEFQVAQGKLTPVEVEPWTLVKFNGTELHRGQSWPAPLGVYDRVFVRVAFRPARR